jgi:hypothetical protein
MRQDGVGDQGVCTGRCAHGPWVALHPFPSPQPGGSQSVADVAEAARTDSAALAAPSTPPRTAANMTVDTAGASTLGDHPVWGGGGCGKIRARGRCNAGTWGKNRGNMVMAHEPGGDQVNTVRPQKPQPLVADQADEDLGPWCSPQNKRASSPSVTRDRNLKAGSFSRSVLVAKAADSSGACRHRPHVPEPWRLATDDEDAFSSNCGSPAVRLSLSQRKSRSVRTESPDVQLPFNVPSDKAGTDTHINPKICSESCNSQGHTGGCAETQVAPPGLSLPTESPDRASSAAHRVSAGHRDMKDEHGSEACKGKPGIATARTNLDVCSSGQSCLSNLATHCMQHVPPDSVKRCGSSRLLLDASPDKLASMVHASNTTFRDIGTYTAVQIKCTTDAMQPALHCMDLQHGQASPRGSPDRGGSPETSAHRGFRGSRLRTQMAAVRSEATHPATDLLRTGMQTAHLPADARTRREGGLHTPRGHLTCAPVDECGLAAVRDSENGRNPLQNGISTGDVSPPMMALLGHNCMHSCAEAASGKDSGLLLPAQRPQMLDCEASEVAYQDSYLDVGHDFVPRKEDRSCSSSCGDGGGGFNQ